MAAIVEDEDNDVGGEPHRAGAGRKPELDLQRPRSLEYAELPKALGCADWFAAKREVGLR
jgi:hypothetical protein